MRRTTAVLLALLFVLTLGNAAHAEAGNAGTDLTSVPSLVSTTFGTQPHTDVSTEPVNGKYNSDCVEAQGTEGAAVYAVPDAPTGTRITLNVTVSASAQELCKVELFRRTNGSSTLADIYNPTERATFHVNEVACAVACSAGWTVPATDTYYVVFWPGGDGTPDHSTFDATTQVLEKTTTTTGISGFFGKEGYCYRVERGKAFLVKARVSPADATGTVRFTLRKRNAEGSYYTVGTSDKSLVDSYAYKSFAPSFGRFSVRANYLGDGLTKAASTSSARCVDVVAHSAVSQKFAGYYGTSGDYFLYHSGRTITLTANVGPVPAGGSVRFRIERENNDTSYTYITNYVRSVNNGKAVLTFSMGYSSKVLPFYRIRSEYLGDTWHFPKNSAWNCVWIKP